MPSARAGRKSRRGRRGRSGRRRRPAGGEPARRPTRSRRGGKSVGAASACRHPEHRIRGAGEAGSGGPNYFFCDDAALIAGFSTFSVSAVAVAVTPMWSFTMWAPTIEANTSSGIAARVTTSCFSASARRIV